MQKTKKNFKKNLMTESVPAMFLWNDNISYFSNSTTDKGTHSIVFSLYNKHL